MHYQAAVNLCEQFRTNGVILFDNFLLDLEFFC